VSPHFSSFHQSSSIFEPDGFAGCEIHTVELAVYLQGATEPPRSVDQLSIDIDRPDQYG
jgi:hypothetical protein